MTRRTWSTLAASFNFKRRIWTSSLLAASEDSSNVKLLRVGVGPPIDIIDPPLPPPPPIRSMLAELGAEASAESKGSVVSGVVSGVESTSPDAVLQVIWNAACSWAHAWFWQA